MKTKKNKFLIAFSVIFYAVFITLMIIGTFYDLEIGKAVYMPTDKFSQITEGFGQIVYWVMWGPALTVLFLQRKDLYDLYDIFIPFTKSKIKPDPNSKAFGIFNKIIKIATPIILFVLTVIGWKKLIQNFTKNVLLFMGRENLGEVFYFIISAVIAVIGIFLFKKLKPETLQKLEGVAIVGCIFGICIKLGEELKPLTSRVRIREMIAYSNGYLNDKGMSEGRYSPLTRDMSANTDFSAFTPWYKKGNDMGRYSRADSFPSGHTLSSCTAFTACILFKPFDKLKKYSPYMLIFAALYVSVMGLTRMLVGAHYLTDVASAAIIGYTAFLFVNCIYDCIIRNKEKRNLK